MNKEQIKQRLEQMQDFLKLLKEDKEEAKPFHSEDSQFMADLDLEILVCSGTVKNLRNQLSKGDR